MYNKNLENVKRLIKTLETVLPFLEDDDDSRDKFQDELVEARGTLEEVKSEYTEKELLPSGTVGDFDDFREKYTLLEFGETLSGVPYLLETFGRELELVKEYKNSRVWTVTEEGGGQFISPGFHFINRLAYIITEQEWEDKNEVYLY